MSSMVSNHTTHKMLLLDGYSLRKSIYHSFITGYTTQYMNETLFPKYMPLLKYCIIHILPSHSKGTARDSQLCSDQR